MRKAIFTSIVLSLSLAAAGTPSETWEIEKQIEAVFGIVERSAEGTIIGIDLARERASTTNDAVIAALSVPRLKRFRIAGGSIDTDSLSSLATQHDLEELYLQDVPLHDAQWQRLLGNHSNLSRLTLRRLSNLSDAALGKLPQRLPALRNLSLIEMELTGAALADIAKSEVLAALDVRHCGRLTADDYRCLYSMPKLVDLKIGGFAVTDDVLREIAPLRFLRGLTIDDALITPEGLEKFATDSASADKLETLVLSRNSALFDHSLFSLKEFPNLKRLTVNGMMVTGSFLELLADEETTRPKLHRLSLRRTFLSQEGMTALKRYPELRILDLSGVALMPEWIDTVVTLNLLEELDVTECGLSEDILQRLELLPSLKRFVR